MLMRVALLGVLIGAAACAAAPRQRPIPMGPVDTGPKSLTAARQYLHGRWSLESFEVYPPGRPPIRLTGSGTLNYDEFGNLRIDIRTDEKTADLLRQAGIETNGGVLSSDGRTVIDLQNQTLTYVVEGQPAAEMSSGPLGLNRPRHWQVEGNLLTLTTKDDQDKAVSVGRWRKVE